LFDLCDLLAHLPDQVGFVPTAAAVPDQTVDRWVEQELQRGRRRVRAGLTMLAVLAAVAIPLVLFVK
jgi:hypothetical protein